MSDVLSLAHITELAQSFERAKVLFAAVELDLFTALGMDHSIGMLFGSELRSTTVVPATSSTLSSLSGCGSVIRTDDMRIPTRPIDTSTATSRAILEP